MSKLIIFDMDGVLVDSKDLHFSALNKALDLIDGTYTISEAEQEKYFEGLPTKNKLLLLTKLKGLPVNLYPDILANKQNFTKELLRNVNTDNELISLFNLIKENNINIAVASNSIRDTIDTLLTSLGISELVDFIVSNEDVKFAKPHPEMYWKAMSHFGVTSDESVIFEDSLIGKVAARDSNAHLIEVKDRKDLTENKVKEAISYLKSVRAKWHGGELNVLIPMAGLGSRFADAGYTFPKPLVEVKGKPMIQAVVESLGIQANYIYVVQEEHYHKFNLQYLLNLITPNCEIIKIAGLTEGAALTCLMAEEFINTDVPLIIANSDQIVNWNSRDFLYTLMTQNADGGILTFESVHPKWSYAKIDSEGLVVEVAEKKPISELATVGIYYWRHGKDFVSSAKNMIAKDIRTNGEFYVCPTYNELIAEGKRIYTYPVERMYGIGTPEDLDYYLKYGEIDV